MHVEFLGIPRERVGVSEVVLDAETLEDVFRTLSARFPSLGGLITAEGLHPSLAANLNGDHFVRDPRTRLTQSDRLLILSADAGG